MAAAEVTNLEEVRARIDQETDSGRRVIEVRAGELSAVVAEAEAALIATGAGIYQRGGQLVRIAKLDKDVAHHGVKRSAGSTVILRVSRDYLPLPLGRAADFQKFDKRAKAMRRIDPPDAVAKAMIAAAGEWKFQTLAGVVTAPTLRRDGSLLDRPGYDEASGLFAAFEAADFEAIPSKPTRDEAEDALADLRELFSECAFAGGEFSAHASVAIAACVTACVRHALPIAPAFGYTAHKPGSGKTTTAKVPAQLTMGRDPPVVAPTDDEAEFKKAMLATLIAGDTVVLVDNIVNPLDSAALCAVLTSPAYSDRILGVSTMANVPTATTWLLTGNSLQLVGDLTTRALLSELDPECEHPEARPFRRNLGDYVLANRGRLVRAALIVPLAYIAAGSPKSNAARSRYAEWDALVRNPLLWLCAADPLDTQAELRTSDPVRESLLGLLIAWRNEFSDQKMTVHRLVEAAAAPGMSARPQLADALRDIAGEKNGDINSKRLGRYLVRNVRRIEGGLRIESAGPDTFTNRPAYKVTNVTGVSSVSASTPREIVE